MDEYNHCINFKDDPLPMTNFSYSVNNDSKEATMTITKNNQPPNLKIYDRFIIKILRLSEWIESHALTSKKHSTFNDQLLKNLKAKFQLVATIARKLGIPPPSQLTVFKLPTTEKKKKRRTELLHEVFVKDNIMVDGMQRNLVHP
ncbi:hypothetical protein Tco_1479641 [Tanacetum coccineum]